MDYLVSKPGLREEEEKEGEEEEEGERSSQGMDSCMDACLWYGIVGILV